MEVTAKRDICSVIMQDELEACREVIMASVGAVLEEGTKIGRWRGFGSRGQREWIVNYMEYEKKI